MKDYYAVLGVQQDDSAEVIGSKYRQLAKKYHPDLNPDNKEAEERFKEIGEAWEILGKPKNRAAYDAKRLKRTGSFGQETKKAGASMGAVDYENLMGQFDSFFGKAMKKEPQQRSGQNPLDARDLFEKFMGIKR